MPTVNIDCPIEGCQYSTGEQEAAIAAALLGIHATSHTPGGIITNIRPTKSLRLILGLIYEINLAEIKLKD